MDQGKKGAPFLLDFLKEQYLDTFIAEGGSKIKFITGRQGSGKSYFLKKMCEAAAASGYITVQFSARKIWLNDFKEIYLEIVRQCDVSDRIRECADEIIRRLNYNPEEIPEGRRFMDFLASVNEANVLNKRAVRNEVADMFLNNPVLDNNFASVCAQLTCDWLGHPCLDDTDRETLVQWLAADKTIRFTVMRTLGLAPVRITKYNARHMLRSLAELVHLSGHKGLFIAVDDLDILQDNSGMEEIHYSKIRRDDAYESIRQMIDDIDTMKYLMFVFGMNRSLIDNEKAGMKSYQALWMRIQNEIVSDKLNRFTDILDLDRLAAQEYDEDYILEMSLFFADEAETRSRNATILNEEKIHELLEKAKYGSVGLPQLIKESTLKGEEE